jgi:phospho-N-acetylmuramoyl-pentapeptide-transferase
MLVELFQWLAAKERLFSVFNYITLRVVLAALTALLISFIIGPTMIRRLTAYKIGQAVRDDGPQTHLIKMGTPTMGGALILVSVAVTTLLWADLQNRYVWIALVTDARLRDRRLDRRLAQGRAPQPQGALGARQVLLAIGDRALGGVLPRLQREAAAADRAHRAVLQDRGDPARRDRLRDPRLLHRGRLLQRGEPHRRPGRPGDHAHRDDRLGARRVRVRDRATRASPSTSASRSSRAPGELAVFCGAIAGAGLAFLWFNAYPAEVFMGDVGALALGAALGIVALVVRQEIVLLIMGGVFVVETLSVMIQVASFKLTGKRVFRWRRCTTTTN